MGDEVAQLLRKLGASEEDVASFAKGEKIWIFKTEGGIKTSTYYRFEGGKLTTGMLELKNLDPAKFSAARTIKSFLDQSTNLARKLDANILRIEGNTVTNLGEKGVEGFLYRLGFETDPYDPGLIVRETKMKGNGK